MREHDASQVGAMTNHEISVIIRRCFPDVQAVYVFGTLSTEYERTDSDADIALLLPHATAKAAGSLVLSECRFALEDLLGRKVDLINLRLVDTVFQFRIVGEGRLILVADQFAAASFEMLTLSFYQKLQQERAPILEQIAATRQVLET